jgi:hypothetical protein
MNAARLGCIVPLALVLTACNWFVPHEYVQVLVNNNAGESVEVETGLTLMTVTIRSGEHETVSIVKGERVQATGKDSGKNYGSRTFYSDGTWTIG